MAILAFHNTSTGFSPGFNNYSPRRFRKALEIIRNSGFKFVSLDEYFRAENRGMLVALTFDDAYESFFIYAFPILSELSVPAAMFVPAAFIGKKDRWDYTGLLFPKNHCRGEQLKRLADSGLIAIGSHGLDHQDLTDMGPRRLKLQLDKSKEILENTIGRRIIYISYPFGRFNTTVELQALESGYERGFSLNYYCKSASGFTLPRYGVYGFDTPWSIIRKISGGGTALFERLKGAVINQYSGGTIALNRIRRIFSRAD